MNNYNDNNERIKRRFYEWAREADGLAEQTIKGISLAIELFEEYTVYKDFKLFNSDKAINFKKRLRKKHFRNMPISETTYRTYLKYLKKFFSWLIMQPGYKSKIKGDSIAYFNLRKKENKMSYQFNKIDYPSPDYCIELAKSIKLRNEIDNRDKAMIAFTFLTGMRPHATVTLPIKCIDMGRLFVSQDPKSGVETKFSKFISSKIFPFDEDLVEHIILWVEYLKKKGFSPLQPIFPVAQMNQTSEHLAFRKSVEVSVNFMKTTSSIRNVFFERAKAAKLKYYPPRTFRHTTIYHALKYIKKGEELKALSQHFGHEDIRTTLSIYGNYEGPRLEEILDQIDFSDKKDCSSEELQKAFKLIASKSGLNFKI